MRSPLGAPRDLGQISEHQRHPVDHGGAGKVRPGSGRSWLWTHRNPFGARSREVDLQEDRDASTRSGRRSHHGSPKEVYGERGKETREAVPIPLALVAALERFVCARFRSSQFVLAFFSWWILITIYSSLRFDDAMHVVPEALAMKDEALYGVVWQTKVERQKKDTRFAVAKVSVSGEEWMEDGWSAASFEMDDRDYFMKELESAERFCDRPATYQRSVLWLRYVLTTAASDDLKRGLISPPDLKGHLQLTHLAFVPSDLCSRPRSRHRCRTRRSGFRLTGRTRAS